METIRLPTPGYPDAGPSLRSWICTDTRILRRGIPHLTPLVAAATSLRRVLPGRLTRGVWIRYCRDLDEVPPEPADVKLTHLDARIIEELRSHPDKGQNQLVSGLNWWDRGLHRAWIWRNEDGPLCLQWLLLPGDIRRVGSLGPWAGMYPPLDEGCGQVENLFAFSSARQKGVATRFEYALFHAARRLGIRRLLTHIHAGNRPAHLWAEKTGWTPYGTIVRYELNLGFAGRWHLYLHRRHPVDMASLTGR